MISTNVDAAYKKLPLNGSMFGKRGTSVGKTLHKLFYFLTIIANFHSIEYESTAQKTLAALCDVCSSYFVNQDVNYVQ
jgi:hypothetical protein